MVQHEDGIESKKRDRPNAVSHKHSQENLSRKTMHPYPLIYQQSATLIGGKTQQQRYS
jgi:hypothetical protein